MSQTLLALMTSPRWVFIESSSNLHWVFIESTLSLHQVFIESSLSLHLKFIGNLEVLPHRWDFRARSGLDAISKEHHFLFSEKNSSNGANELNSNCKHPPSAKLNLVKSSASIRTSNANNLLVLSRKQWGAILFDDSLELYETLRNLK